MVAWEEAESLDYFALKVEPGKERMAESILCGRNIMAKLAKRSYEQTVKISRRIPAKVTRYTMLLPGIIFVAFPKEEPIPWFALRQRLHIIRGVIGSNNVPSRIRDYENLLRLFEDIVFTDAQIAKFRRTYTTGERVRMTTGALAGREAVVVSATADDMVVLVELFGRQMSVAMSGDQIDTLEPVATAAA